MTFGSGMSGCLGHGNFDDVVKVCGFYFPGNLVVIIYIPQPKLVEQMLQYETTDIACGGYHMLAITCR